jgi:hypothetical protein
LTLTTPVQPPDNVRLRQKAHLLLDILLDEAERNRRYGELAVSVELDGGTVRYIRERLDFTHK